MESENRFTRCLLEQKDDESRLARQRRRRSVLIAILIQLIVLALLMLRPLFGAPAVLFAVERYVPLPPWKGSPAAIDTGRRPEPPGRRRMRDVRPDAFTFLPPAHPVDHLFDSASAPDIGPVTDGPPGPGFGDPNGLLENPGLPGVGMPPALPPPPHLPPPPPAPRFVPSEIQQALLVTRIDPVYPPLAKQIRLEGTVLIRAVIAQDGRIESAEVLSGNPLFVRAALDAILRWRYRPTLLNGRPVEVETLITVIFRLH
ncbi:MAG TPA: energy transducer TonB [Candidatus Acidoferrales bacterium]|nr:energy transducer TonB [Candidatus Acidoferrales bacterium]